MFMLLIGLCSCIWDTCFTILHNCYSHLVSLASFQFVYIMSTKTPWAWWLPPRTRNRYSYSLEGCLGNTLLDRSDDHYKSSADFVYNFVQSIGRISVAIGLRLSSRLMISTPQSSRQKDIINHLSMARVTIPFPGFSGTTILTEKSLGVLGIVSLVLAVVWNCKAWCTSPHAYRSSVSDCMPWLYGNIVLCDWHTSRVKDNPKPCTSLLGRRSFHTIPQ